MAFVLTPSLTHVKSHRQSFLTARRTVACADTAPSSDGPSVPDTQHLPSLSPRTLNTLLHPTMLRDKELTRIYASSQHGFSHTAFFDQLMPLDGVPALVLGRTVAGTRFGGYTSHGFAARDDYREASKPTGLFVFRIDDGQDDDSEEGNDTVVIADPTDLVLYDFADFAVRFGASLLTIPMNVDKHGFPNDTARSTCRMPDGSTSVLGSSSLAKLETVDVFVASEYVSEQGGAKRGGGLFGRLFG